MDGLARDAAVERVERLVDTVETELMPVPVREVWVYGEVALGLDPIERLDVYVTKDLLYHDDTEVADLEPGLADVEGIGESVRAAWASEHPASVRTNPSGHVAPEQCLGAHLLEPEEPIHLEVCNTGFEANVTQRLEGALARDTYGEVIDPRGVCLWVDGTRSADAFEKLRAGSLTFPTLAEALEMIGADAESARRASETLESRRTAQDGASIRGDVV